MGGPFKGWNLRENYLEVLRGCREPMRENGDGLKKGGFFTKGGVAPCF